MSDTINLWYFNAMILAIMALTTLPPLEGSTVHNKELLVKHSFCSPMDSDDCLQSSSGWRGYTCSNSIRHCDSWSKDVRRCCPESCNNTIAFTETICNESKGRGDCKYPNDAQCPEGIMCYNISIIAYMFQIK